jgi:hypothetical protein
LPLIVDKWLLLMAILGAAGLLVVVLFHDRGVPIAAIDLRVLQPGAEAVARTFLETRGIDLTGYRAAVSFETDRDAQGYLERVAGQRALDRIAATDVTVWRWRVRFFRELDPLEYIVSVRPDGAVVGWSRVLPEGAPAPSLDESAARALAESALREAGRTLEGWSPAGTARETRPNRVDYRFTWERDDWQVGEATIRQTVVIQGDTVGGWFDFLRTPERWVRALRIESNRGVVLANAGWTLTYALGLGAAVVFLIEWRAGRTQRTAPLALVGGFVVVGLAALLNQLPLWVASAPTTVTVAAYVLAQARDQVSQLAPSIVAVGLAAAAGFAIWPRAFPVVPSPLADLTPAALRTRRFVTAVVFSYLAAGAWLGYFTLYYWLGSTVFGFWSPVELPYRDVMSGAFPPAFPLFVGAGAAIAEETVFRLFAIPAGALALAWLWRRMVGQPPGPRARIGLLGVVMVVIALVWGSLHSTYPQLPFYVRAIEVAVIGVVAGVVLLRWGLVATLLTHYVGNTSIVGALFLLSGNPLLQVAALVVIALPLVTLLPAAVALARGAALPDLPPQPSIEPATRPTPAASRQAAVPRWPTVALLPPLVVLGLLAALAPPRPDDGLRLATTREEAVAAAERAVRAIGAPLDLPLVVAALIDRAGGAEATFLLRTVGPETTARVYDTVLPPAVWNVRFVRPLEKDEVAVQVGPNGALVGVVRQVEDAAPGASPTAAEAQAIAERWLRELTGRSDWVLVTASQLRRENRVDSSFVWERPDWSAGPADAAATLRVQILLYGNELGAFQPFLKVPEEFLRSLRRDTGLEGSAQTLRDLALLGGIAALAVSFARAVRRNEVDLGVGGRLAAVAGAGLLVSLAADFPTLLASYVSTLDLLSFAVWLVSGQVRSSLITLAAVAVLGALGPGLLRRAGSSFGPPSGREIGLGIVGALAVAGGGLAGWSAQAWAAPTTLRAPTGLPAFAGLPPVALAASEAVVTGLLGGAVAAVALLVISPLPRVGQGVLVATVGALVGAAGGVGGELAVGGLLGAGGGLLVLLYGWVVGPSLWAPILAVGGAVLISQGVGLLRHGANGWYAVNGAAALVVGLVIIGLLLWRQPRQRQSATPAAESQA